MAQPTGGASSPTWEELLGSDHWAGLLHPLDQSLRHFLLKLGDFQTVTEAYITDDQSKMYVGSCRYGVDSLFQKTFFPFAADYCVYGFLYFTAQSWNGEKKAHWNGYVAVSTDDHASATGRREIYVVLRGTEGRLEFLNDLHVPHVQFDTGEPDVKVMQGWHEMFCSEVGGTIKMSLREQLQEKITKLVEEHKDEKLSIVCVGHSMGGALAILSAYDIVKCGLSKVGDEYFPVTAVTFESPRVGDSAFDCRLKTLEKLRVLRVANADDPVPKVPRLFYVDNGEHLEVDSRKSSHLKHGHGKHNLEVVLHAVSGWEGGKFDPSKGGRDRALVNKHSDFLLDEYKVPSTWWVEKNKAMVLGKDGTWSETPPEDRTLIDT